MNATASKHLLSPPVVALNEELIIIMYEMEMRISVRDIAWLSDLSVHLAKWMHALEQVTDGQNVTNFLFS